MKRPGRRPGKQDTSAAILSAARAVFAERGFDRASIRAIASAADVDPALVHHYFGTKHDLFIAVIRPPTDPTALIPRILGERLTTGPGGVGERFAGTFLSVLEQPESGAAMRGLIRSAITDETSARLIKEFFHTQVVRQIQQDVAHVIPRAQVPRRASFVASQIFGLVVTRYLLELEPLARATTADVVAAVAPTLERYLFGDLGPDLPACWPNEQDGPPDQLPDR